MVLRSIKKSPAEVQAADGLRKEIISGRIAPGARLIEATLADEFDVSRGTVRIALHQLAQEGLIIQVPYTGWTVMPMTSHDAWELYTLRASLEGLAARLATENLDDEGRTLVKDAYQALVDACNTADRRKVAEADFKLHKSIVRISKHNRLINQYRLVEQQIRIYIASSDVIIADYADVIAHHEPIVQSILNGDSDGARHYSELHSVREGKKLFDFLLEKETKFSSLFG